MKAAASNPNGAMNAFMGYSMAQNAGGINAGELYKMAGSAAAANAANPAGANTWKCECGAENTGNFCQSCACGAVNKGKFCPNCGDPFGSEDIIK